MLSKCANVSKARRRDPPCFGDAMERAPDFRMARAMLFTRAMSSFRPRLLVRVSALVLGIGAAHCSGGLVVTDSAPDGGDDAGTRPDGAVQPPDGALPPRPLPPRTGKPGVHRASDASCASPRPPGTNRDAGAVPDSGSAPFQRCGSDAECTLGTNGRCLGSREGLTCSYDTCAADSDCASRPNGVCACRNLGGLGTNNQCTQGGNCKVDTDCAGGTGYCSPSFEVGCNLGFQGFFCHTPKDSCLGDSDCNEGADPRAGGSLCTYDPTAAKWACSRVICAG